MSSLIDDLFEKKGETPLACKVIYPYNSQNDDELTLKEGEIIYVLEKCDDGWFVGISSEKFGTFPGNYVRELEEVEK